jgi:hypothetical protein
MMVNGIRFILVEFALGIFLPLILGFIELRAGLVGPAVSTREVVLGFWLISIAFNYIPLFFYAIPIAKGGNVKQEGQPELAQAKRYTIKVYPGHFGHLHSSNFDARMFTKRHSEE